MIMKHISEAGREALDYMKGRQDGTIKSLRTRWNKFNEQVGLQGLEWNTINTFCGMSSSGKTLILSELETSLFDLNPGQEFAIISNNYEMLARNLIIRKLSSRSYNNSLKPWLEAFFISIVWSIVTTKGMLFCS